jgi:hypothetical protein
MSETSESRGIFMPYCVGIGLDMGFGGDLVVKTALGFDMPKPYTSVGGDHQTFRGDCRDMSGFCDGCMDYIHSAHLLEDFSYEELATRIIPEWRRVLKVGGYLMTNCPDQRKFLAHCASTGQPINLAHKELDFSLEKWNHHVVANTGNWEVVLEQDGLGPYSWIQILRKVP